MKRVLYYSHFEASPKALRASSTQPEALVDFAEIGIAGTAELGSVLRRLVPAVKDATDVERIYHLALMENVAPSLTHAEGRTLATSKERGISPRIPLAREPSVMPK
jgi:hypothetical protein